jgi:pyrroloquinoline quinone (PQQ) biosynthesis protein C
MLRNTLDHLFDDVLAGRRLLAHPFYRRWEAGRLEPAELAAYAGQYRHFEQALPEVLEALVDGLGPGPARDSVQANLDDERGVPAPHLELFDDFAQAVGAQPAAPEPATSALVGLYRRLSASDPVAALAALAAYEVQAPEIAVSKAAGLRARYGLSDAQTRFWDVHGTMDGEHAAWVLDALDALDADPETVRAGAVSAAEAWWAFLDEREARQEAAAVPAAC